MSSPKPHLPEATPDEKRTAAAPEERPPVAVVEGSAPAIKRAGVAVAGAPQGFVSRLRSAAARIRAPRAAFAFGIATAVAALATTFLARPPKRTNPASPTGASLEGLVPCTSSGGVDRSDRLVFGRLDGKLLSEVLRAHDLRPDDVYRLRQALERIPGFHSPSSGRFVASLDGASGALDAFQLVVTPAEVYRASSDSQGSLVGERSQSEPERRTCFGSMRVGSSFAESLRAAPFHREIAAPLEAALGDQFAKERAEIGTTVRLIAREVLAMGAFAGYDDIEAVEIVPGGDGSRARRAYRFAGERGSGYFDAQGNHVSQADTALNEADRPAFQRWVTLLNERLDGIAWPPAAPAAADPEPRSEDAEPSVPRKDAPPRADPSRTVARAALESCSTRIVEGLSRQIIAEARCLSPDAFVRVKARKNLKVNTNVFLYLEAPARDHLLAVLDAHPRKVMTVNSALRTLPQQVLLAKWGETRRCGVRLAASPRESNHESGLALDVQEAAAWRTVLEQGGFRWMGREDPVHFDYEGPHAVDHRGLDVRAFQRLWNRNHADDVLPESGQFDSATAARVAKSPAAGFPEGPTCAPIKGL